MAKYFSYFPSMFYDAVQDGTTSPKLVTDLLRRVKVRDEIKNNVAAFSTLSTLLGFIGPPLFGLMAETIGLRIAFLLVIPLVIISFIQAKRLK